MSQFYILPTTDIHLVLDASITNGQQFTLKFVIQDPDKTGSFNPDFLNVEIEDGSTLITQSIIYDPNDPEHKVEIIITAQQAGLSFIRVRYDIGTPDPQGNPTGQEFQECFVRVWVHNAIESIWINNNHLTICRGAEFQGYVPSVFAKFTDSEIGDITYHPYLDYNEVNDGTNLTIDNHIIKAPNVTTEIPTSLIISVKGQSTLNDNVEVTIKAPFDEPREILRKLHIGQKGHNAFHLLVLGDGFTNQSEFDICLYRTVVKLLDESNLLSPWNLLSDNITIWSAFEPTINDKEGITINYPVNEDGHYIANYVGSGYKPGETGSTDPDKLTLSTFIERVGLPDHTSPTDYDAAKSHWNGINEEILDKEVFDDWLKYNKIKGYVENKDSRLGIRIGNRFGDKIKSHYTHSPTENDKIPVNRWYYQHDRQRSLGFDRRRYPEYYADNPIYQHTPYNSYTSTINNTTDVLADAGYIDRYLDTLKYIDRSEGTPKPPGDEYDMGKTWKTDGENAGRVIILSNHYKHAGTNVSGSYTIDNVFKHLVSYSLLTLLNQDHLNLSPTTGYKLEDNVSAQEAVYKIDAVYLAGLLGHEFMHSIFIGDEYEGTDQDPDSDEIDVQPNLATIDYLAKPGDGNITNKVIDPAKIKWNLKRVALSSMIVDTVTMSGNILTVKLEKGQSTGWQRVLVNELPLYIRSSRFQPNKDIIFDEWAINKITEIDSSTDTVKLELVTNLGDPDLVLLNRGCHIYLPKRLNDDYSNDTGNHKLRIINPRVFEYIENTEAPLSTKDCNYSSKPAYPPSDSDINTGTDNSTYPEFSSPSNRFLVSGLYEGGGLHNCKVYRPSGYSLMRLPGIRSIFLSDVNANGGRTFITDKSSAAVHYPNSNVYYTIYSRFDFFSKYFFIATFYPTKLGDLDKEYNYHNSSNPKT